MAVIGPIPSRAIRAWLEDHPDAFEDEEEFRLLIRHLDAIYTSHVNNKGDTGAPPPSTPSLDESSFDAMFGR